MGMFSVFYPVYQPIVSVDTRQIAHIEALVRLSNDNSGCAHRQLLDVAERCKFIGHVDMQMLRLVMAGLDRHQYKVAVNLSPTSIDSHAKEFLAVLGASPRRNRLLIEITESAEISNPESLALFVQTLQKLGVCVAVDDYGNNEGCFTADLVRLLHPDFLKLDGTVLKRAAWLNNASELYSAMDLADEVGARVIAEFVDTRAKQEMLRTVGIQYGQGLAYGGAHSDPNKLGAQVRPALETSFAGNWVSRVA